MREVVRASRRGFLFAGIVLGVALLSRPASGGQDPIVGAGKGLDHVGVVVNGLDDAKRDYEALGFRVSSGGLHADGTRNAIVRCANGSYIELVVAEQQTSQDADIARFLKAGDGAEYFGLETSDANASQAALRRRHIRVSNLQPGTIIPDGLPLSTRPPPFWYSFEITERSWADDPAFFIQFLAVNRASFDALHQQGRPKRKPSGIPANGARRLRAIWLLADDPQREVRRYVRAGFRQGPPITVGSPFDVTGSTVLVADTQIVFLPAGVAGRARVKTHDGFASIALIQLDTADVSVSLRATYGMASKVNGRDAVLVPPDRAHGVWLAFTK